MAGRREDGETNASLAAMVELCEDLLDGRSSVFESSADLLKRTSETEGLAWIKSTKKLASFLGSFDLVVGRQSGGKIRGYLITREWADDVKVRYLMSLTLCKASQPSQTEARSGFEGIL
jgi:hypothetical protein